MNRSFARRIRSGEIGSVEELKAAFKRLAKETHPDLGGSGAMDDFISVRADYERALAGFERIRFGSGAEPAAARFDRAAFYARLGALLKRGFPKIPRHEKERLRYEYARHLFLGLARAWGPGRGEAFERFEAALARAKAGRDRGFDEAIGLVRGILEYHEGGSRHARDGLRLQHGLAAGGILAQSALRDFIALLVEDLDGGPALRAEPASRRRRR